MRMIRLLVDTACLHQLDLDIYNRLSTVKQWEEQSEHTHIGD